MMYTRRELGKLAFAALPATSLWQAKPNSKISGAQIGLNVPYSFGNNLMSGDETLQRCVQLGLSAVELRSQPVEAFLGVPANLIAGKAGQAPAAIAEVRKARLSASMAKVKEFRRKSEDAGVLIEIVKFDAIYGQPDEVIDYCFTLATNLGARAISCELSVDDSRRLGQFADKHKMMVGYHGHAATTPANWETAFSYAKYNGANVDIGHFVAGNNTSPVPFLQKHHDRITHVHVKDRKMNNGPNTPFGQGDTPIKEVLRLIRDNKWKIQATIEFEYPVPEGSDRMTEIAKCVQYCREALTSA